MLLIGIVNRSRGEMTALNDFNEELRKYDLNRWCSGI